MRIAIAGKGGAGKTTICAIAARLLARDGRRVVAIDGDSNPNLHAALGVMSPVPTRQPPSSLPTSLVARRRDGPALTVPVTEVLERFAVQGRDGVHLLRMASPEHPDEGCLCGAHATVSALLSDLGDVPETVTLLDLEASPEHLGRGTARHADVLVLVAEPYFRSLEAVRLQAQLAGAASTVRRVVVVANKCRSAADVEAIEEFCARRDLDLVGVVPWSDAVLDADAAATPVIDVPGAHEVVDAIAEVLARLFDSVAAAGPEARS